MNSSFYLSMLVVKQLRVLVTSKLWHEKCICLKSCIYVVKTPKTSQWRPFWLKMMAWVTLIYSSWSKTLLDAPTPRSRWNVSISKCGTLFWPPLRLFWPPLYQGGTLFWPPLSRWNPFFNTLPHIKVGNFFDKVEHYFDTPLINVEHFFAHSSCSLNHACPIWGIRKGRKYKQWNILNHLFPYFLIVILYLISGALWRVIFRFSGLS